MLELFETESGTVLATYTSLDEAMQDIREEVRVGGRVMVRTWALGKRQQDGRIVCIATGEGLADRVQARSASAAS